LLGNLCLARERLDEAVVSFEQSLHLRPGHALGHNNLGIARVKQGNLEEAVACFRQALTLEPGYTKAYNNLGAALTDQGKFEEAAACLEQALHLDPQYAEARCNLQKALCSQQQKDRQTISQQKVITLPAAEVLNREGVDLAQAGKLEDASAKPLSVMNTGL